MRWASGAGNASYRAPGECLERLSITTRITSAFGSCTSTKSDIFGEVAGRAVVGELDVAPRTVRIDTHKQVYGTVAAIFGIVAARLLGRLPRVQPVKTTVQGTSPKLRFSKGATSV
jgi:hypothetical protein